jgi:hypothetical protein
MAEQQPPLVLLTELEQYGIAWRFVDKFTPRPVLITISTGGVIGTMQYTWQLIDTGQQDTSAPYPTVAIAGGAWSQRISDAYADLVWQPGTYLQSTSYTIDVAGNVYLGAGAGAGLSAARFDMRQVNIQAATDLALGWMAPAVVPPLASWGADVKSRAAGVWDGLMLDIRGAAPREASPGDDRVLARAREGEEWFKAVGRGEIAPQNLIDSSPSPGGGLQLLPTSAAARGW